MIFQWRDLSNLLNCFFFFLSLPLSLFPFISFLLYNLVRYVRMHLVNKVINWLFHKFFRQFLKDEKLFMCLAIAAVHNEIIYFFHASNFAHTAAPSSFHPFFVCSSLSLISLTLFLISSPLSLALSFYVYISYSSLHLSLLSLFLSISFSLFL